MSKIITAKFNSIDAATLAASNAKDRCDNISSVKVKYKALDDKSNFEPYPFLTGAAPLDVYSPTVFQTGMFPVAVNVDPLSDYGRHNAKKPKKATVEITARGENVNPICSTLRQGGGISLKVR